MREAFGSLWDLSQDPDAIAVTTNGSLKSNGHLVMGAGCAKEAALGWPVLPKVIGQHVKLKGNHVQEYLLRGEPWSLVTFPTKHSWYEDSNLGLIIRSAQEILVLADKRDWTLIQIPRPGAGHGQLDWDIVKAAIDPILDDRFVAITFPPKEDSNEGERSS